jgi:prolyl-tRNA synthetase
MTPSLAPIHCRSEPFSLDTLQPDPEKQIKEDKEIADRLLTKLCLPYVFSKRPEWDKFAGAFYTISIDVLMPSGKTLQIGSIHQYRDNFSKPYEISHETENGDHMFCHQTTYGMSERLLGAIIGVHGDNKGLVIPLRLRRSR